MVQWTNLQQNNRFINQTQLHIHAREKSGVLYLAKLGTDYYSRQVGQLTSKQNAGKV